MKSNRRVFWEIVGAIAMAWTLGVVFILMFGR